MSLKDKLDAFLKMKEELYEEHGIISVDNDVVRGLEVHISSSLADYLDLASEIGILIEARGIKDCEYPCKATFEKDGYTFFRLLTDDEKAQLEKLINEREAEGKINE